MPEININKRDVLWGYVATFFQVASGIIVLPFILHFLSKEEVGLNYVMLTVGAMVSLFDFGFTPQFGRNFAYIFSGAKDLVKEGLQEAVGDETDYRLLRILIDVARRVYSRISIIVLLLMLTAGTVYIRHVTDGFTLVRNSLIIWIIYSISTFFNLFYTYYSSLLVGKGMVMESKKAMMASRITYIVLAIGFIYAGMGLLGVVLANLIAPFVLRFMSYRYFFTPEMKGNLAPYHAEREDLSHYFGIIWHNARKIGLVMIGTYGINRFGMFLAGLFLTLEEVGSYGLMMQLVNVTVSLAANYFYVSEPQFALFRVRGETQRLLKRFALTMNVFYLVFAVGTLFLIFACPPLLELIKSQSVLPGWPVLLVYSIVILLEQNHSLFSSIIVVGNEVPYVKPALLSGLAIVIGSYLSLRFTAWGIMGLVLVQGLCQLAYNNWKWPLVVCRNFGISFPRFLQVGMQESLKKVDDFMHHRL